MLAQQVNPLAFKPQSMAGLLDESVRLYRRHWLPMIGIVAVIEIPAILIALLLSTLPATLWSQEAFQSNGLINFATVFSPTYYAVLGGSLLSILISFTLGLVLFVAGGYAAGCARLGLPVTVGEPYRFVARRLSSVGGLIVWALAAAFLILFWSIFAICIGWATTLGLILFFSGVALPLAGTVMAWEGLSGSDCVRRGWDLGRRRFWWVIGFTLLISLFTSALTLGPGLLVGWAAQAISGGAAAAAQNPALAIGTQVISTLVQSLMAVLVMPVGLIARTLLYFDLREKTEGLSLALTATDPALPLAEQIKRAPSAPNGRLITGDLLLGFFGITVAGFALYVVLVAAAVAFGLTLGPMGLR